MYHTCLLTLYCACKLLCCRDLTSKTQTLRKLIDDNAERAVEIQNPSTGRYQVLCNDILSIYIDSWTNNALPEICDEIETFVQGVFQLKHITALALEHKLCLGCVSSRLQATELEAG